jgi:hypothetical protein
MTILLSVLLRKARRERTRVVAWLLWLMYSLAFWVLCLPGLERTNEPGPEGLAIRFLVRWGAFFVAAWLVVQHWLGTRADKRRGFPLDDK